MYHTNPPTIKEKMIADTDEPKHSESFPVEATSSQACLEDKKNFWREKLNEVKDILERDLQAELSRAELLFVYETCTGCVRWLKSIPTKQEQIAKSL